MELKTGRTEQQLVFAARASPYAAVVFSFIWAEKRMLTCKRMNLLAELQDHKKLLEFFKPLPRCIRKKVQEFHMSKLPFLLCPVCGAGYYSIPLGSKVETRMSSGCFMCEHNYFMLRFSRPSTPESVSSNSSDFLNF